MSFGDLLRKARSNTDSFLERHKKIRKWIAERLEHASKHPEKIIGTRKKAEPNLSAIGTPKRRELIFRGI